MRWLVVVLFPVLLLSGCDLNPQPEVPGSDEPGAGGSAGAAGAPGAVATSAREPGEREPAPEVGADDQGGGLWAGKASGRDAGPVREALDAGADSAAAPPVVVVQ
jgi:hypothetical protein